MPAESKTTVFCHICDYNFDCDDPDKPQAKRDHKRHVTADQHYEPLKLNCQYCGRVFLQQLDFKKHKCIQESRKKVDYQPFNLKLRNSELVKFLLTSGKPKSHIIEVLQEEKVAVPSMWPPLNVPVSWLQNQETRAVYEMSGNLNGTSYLQTLLKEKVKLGGENSMILFKNIQVMSDDSHVVQHLSAEVTKPNDALLLVTDYSDTQWKVSLKNPPKVDPLLNKPSPLTNDQTLRLHHQFGTKAGFTHEPHRYPKLLTTGMNKFQMPWMLSEKMMFNYTGLTCMQFWSLCDVMEMTQLGNLTKVPITQVVMLFRLKIRQGFSNLVLADVFGITKEYVQELFVATCIYLNKHFHNIPPKWTNESTTDEEIDTIFAELNGNLDPMFDEIRRRFKDPNLETDRKEPMILLVDSTKFKTVKSADREKQNAMWSKHKGCHCLTVTHITTLDGTIVWCSCLATSISPRQGDLMIMSHMLSEDQYCLDHNEKLKHGLIRILRGTRKHFIVLVTDRGYSFVPHNVKKKGLPLLPQWCKENHVLFLSPVDKEMDWIMQWNETTRKLEPKKMDELEGDESSLIKNHRKLQSILRKFSELQFGSVKHNKFLNGILHFRYLRRIGDKLLKRLRLNPNFRELSLVQIVWLSMIAIFNLCHPKFHLQFASEELQRRMAFSLFRRINLPNLFSSVENTQFEVHHYPKANAGFTPVKIKDIWTHLDSLGFPLRKLKKEQESLDALADLELGQFLLHQVPGFSLLIRKMELVDTWKDRQSSREYKELLKQKPSEAVIMVRKMTERPADYNEELYGEWPSSGVICMALRVPSQNQRPNNDKYYKTAWLFLSEEPNTKLQLKTPLKQLFSWKCTNKMKRIDLCDRMAGMGTHTFTFLMVILAYDWYTHQESKYPVFFDTYSPEFERIYRVWTDPFIGSGPEHGQQRRRRPAIRTTDSSPENTDEDDDPNYIEESEASRSPSPYDEDHVYGVPEVEPADIIMEDMTNPLDQLQGSNQVGYLALNSGESGTDDEAWETCMTGNESASSLASQRSRNNQWFADSEDDEPSGFLTLGSDRLQSSSLASSVNTSLPTDAPVTSTPARQSVKVITFNPLDDSESEMVDITPSIVSPPKKRKKKTPKESPLERTWLLQLEDSEVEEESPYFAKKRKKSNAKKPSAKRSKVITGQDSSAMQTSVTVSLPAGVRGQAQPQPSTSRGLSATTQTEESFRLVLEDTLESTIKSFSELSTKDKRGLVAKFKAEVPWFKQFQNAGASCWFGTGCLGLIWFLKCNNIDMPEPMAVDNPEVLPFKHHFFKWFHDKSQSNIDVRVALKSFVDTHYPDASEELQLDLLHGQQEAYLLLLALLNEPEFDVVRTEMKENIDRPDCRPVQDDQEVLCTPGGTSDASENYEGMLQTSMQTRPGMDNLQAMVCNLQDENCEANCEECRSPIMKTVRRRLINNKQANGLIVNVKRTVHDSSKCKPSYDTRTARWTLDAAKMVKNNSEIEMTRDLFVTDQMGAKVGYTLVSAIQHIGKSVTGNLVFIHSFVQ